MTESQVAPATGARLGRSFWTIAALIFLASFLFQLLAMDRVIGIYDEGLDLYGGDIVAHGGVPYRDFFTLYAPAQFYIIAGLFKLFGTTALIVRLYDLLVRTGIFTLCALLTLRLVSRRAAIFTGAATLLWLAGPYVVSYDFPIYPALLLSLLACRFTFSYLAQPSRRQLLLAGGFCAGLAACFRHDTGFYAFLAQLLVIAWSSFDQPGRSTADRIRRAVPPLLLLTSASLVPLLLFFLPVALAAGFGNTYMDLFYVPAVIYPKVRSLPYPTLHAVLTNFLFRPFSEMENIVFFPITAWAASVATLADRGYGRTLLAPTWKRKAVVLLLLLDVLLFITGNARVGFIQMIQAILLGIVLLTVAAAGWRSSKLLTRAFVAFSMAWLLLCSIPLFISLRWHAGANVRAIVQPSGSDSLLNTCRSRPGLDRARCLIVDPPEAAALIDVEQHTSPREPIYVGVMKHDRLLLNNLRFYFLSGHPSVTKWHMLHPGVQTTLPIQREMVQAMEESKTRVVVETNVPMKENSGSRKSSGVTLLDDYIAANYEPEQSFPAQEGTEIVFFRKPRTADPPPAK